MVEDACAVLFDMDGTLIENAYPFVQAKSEILELLRGRGISVPEDLYGSIASLLVELGKLGPAGDALKSEVFRILAKYDEESTRDVKPRRGVVSLLRRLKREGYKVGLISNSNAEVVWRVLKKTGLQGFFDVVVTRECVERMKPYPDMVVFACRKLGVKPSRAIVVGDSWVDVEAGLRAGAKTIYLNVRGTPIGLKPTYVADSLSKVFEVIRGAKVL